ncbi:MAG: protein disulfide oxidoreductase [Gammaproteobacteria bacterium]
MQRLYKKLMDWKNSLGPWQRRLLFIALLVAVYFSAQLYSQRHLVAGAAPVFRAVTLQGQVIDPQVWRERPVLLHFWATWCPICKLEQDMINSLARDYQVVTVAMNSGGEDAIEQYLEEHGLSFPVIVDPDGALARRFGVSGVPTGFIIDRHGQIRFREIGLTSSWGWRARLQLAEWW